MLKRFNVALIPTQANQQVIDCASHFSKIADNYLLGEHSLPHLTLYQFNASESDITSVIAKLASSPIANPIHLSFETFSCISFDQKVHWASLMPDKMDALTQLHQKVAAILGQPIKPSYDPHMTLMNTRQGDYEVLVDAVKKNYEVIKDTFVLSIGESDEVGQYLKVIHRFEEGK